MNLPVIDIPVKLPFDVPVLVHPIFVHFAIAIPIIVLLIELVNLKAKKPAVSITSLFLLTLAIVVYAGAFFTGKADGTEAFALLGPEAKEELKFHKLLGTYLVYGTGVLFLLKLGAMAIRMQWARTLFIFMLTIFIAILLKQGKDGGELVYEYGVNVKPVMSLQDKVDDMQFDIEDLKEELKKAKEECADNSETGGAENETAQEIPAASVEDLNESQTPIEQIETPLQSGTIGDSAETNSAYKEVAPQQTEYNASVAIPTH